MITKDQFVPGAPVSDMVKKGRAILGYKNQLTKKLADRASVEQVGGEIFATVNCPYELVSDTAQEIRELHGDDVPALLWSYDGATRQYKYSMRSTDEGIDVEEIAKKFGGGGHRNAAGFTSCDFLIG